MDQAYLQQLLDIAKKAARRAGAHARREISSAEARLKTGDQIVTQVDLECQKMVIETLERSCPDHGFIGEEQQDRKLFKRAPNGPENLWWVIDPIDGTRNYAHGTPQYAVSIALMAQGHPLVGVIYDPSTDMLFSACRGGPAHCSEHDIACRGEPLDENSQIAVSSRMVHHYERFVIKAMDDYAFINLGSAALHYAYVALGAYAAALSWRTKLWDIAAGAVIAQAAGARVTDLHGQPVFPFSCEQYEGQAVPVMMAGPAAADDILAMLQKNGK